MFDVLARLLRTRYDVTYVRNITDVDDKINRAAKEQCCDISVISSRYRDAYNEDMAALGVLPPDIEPHATDHIGPMCDMISDLISGASEPAVSFPSSSSSFFTFHASSAGSSFTWNTCHLQVSHW